MSQRYSANGWFAASIYRPDTGDVVQLNELVPELCAIENGTIQQELTFSKYQAAKSHVLKIGSTDFDAFETIRQWAEEKRLVRAVVAGTDRNVQFYESVEIGEFLLEPKGRRREGDTKWGIALEAMGRNPQVFNNQNLLAYLGWQDANPVNGLADNWQSITSSGTIVPTFVDRVQILTVTVTGTGAQFRTPPIAFPIGGITVTFSMNTTGNSKSLGILFLDYAGIELSRTVMASASGITQRQGLIPANTYQLRVLHPFENSILAGEIINNSNPALTVNGKVTPGTKFMGW